MNFKTLAPNFFRKFEGRNVKILLKNNLLTWQNLYKNNPFRKINTLKISKLNAKIGSIPGFPSRGRLRVRAAGAIQVSDASEVSDT
ncbi:MAG: hypothetical protein KDD12_16095 [Lewinella sp.]|nr:hypothetical protein [Lewinella sp.]